jgi:hypothetical protein
MLGSGPPVSQALRTGPSDQPVFYAPVQLLFPMSLVRISHPKHSPLPFDRRGHRHRHRHRHRAIRPSSLSRWTSMTNAPASRRGKELHAAAPRTSELRTTGIELHNNAYPLAQTAMWHCVANTCYECRFQTSQVTNVANTSRCCIYCNSYIKIFHLFLYVRCKCFIWMLLMFHIYIASVYFNCFICF